MGVNRFLLVGGEEKGKSRKKFAYREQKDKIVGTDGGGGGGQAAPGATTSNFRGPPPSQESSMIQLHESHTASVGRGLFRRPPYSWQVF
ncbi:hypothetical protein R1flu_027277 [Riccia fluitans]|uniref:Uncharacterized protein n=1 Tax=Riccia fluitans TaxID=41844 RepID=A0ABD1XID8_9MARC